MEIHHTVQNKILELNRTELSIPRLSAILATVVTIASPVGLANTNVACADTTPQTPVPTRTQPTPKSEEHNDDVNPVAVGIAIGAGISLLMAFGGCKPR